MGESQHMINRRTVTKGIAWSVPAVAVAGAAPAFAGSAPNCVGDACVTLSGNVCKHPGEPKYYHFEVCFTNTGPAVEVTFTEMIINGVSRTTIPTTYTIPANVTNSCIVVDAGLYADSANGASELKFTIGGTAGSAKGTFNDINPCGTGNETWRKDQPKTDPPHDGTIVPTTTADDGVATSEEPLTTGADEQVAETQTVEETQVEEAAAEALTDAEELTEPVTETQPIESVSETEVVEESNGAVEGDTE